MSKRRKKVPKSGPIVIDAMTIWQAQKPHYNAYLCGHGIHGDTKYNRKQKHKKDWSEW